MAPAKPIHDTFTIHEQTKSLDRGLAQLHLSDRIKRELNASEKTQLSDNAWDILSDSDKIPEYDPRASTDNVLRPPTTQQANWQPPLLSLRSTHMQAEEVKEEVARFDKVLEEILRQKKIAEEHAARQAVTRKQPEEVAKKEEENTARQALTRKQRNEVAKTAEDHTAILVLTRKQWNEVAKIAEDHTARQTLTRKQRKKAKAAKAKTDRLQRCTQTYTQVSLCSHQFFWISIPGRWRCEYHSYSPGRYINPFRFRCPECDAVACGLCMKKLKRGDTLSIISQG